MDNFTHYAILLSKMNFFVITGSILAITAYLPLFKQLYKRETEQNIFTWSLWTLSETIIALSIIFQNGNYLLPTTYALASFFTVFLILKMKNPARWGWFESTVSLLVIMCLIIWHYSGPKMATIASSSAEFIASLPQIFDAWKNPTRMPLLVYFLYTIAGLLSVAGGENWSVEERLFPMTSALICFLIFAFTLRQFLTKTSD